MQSALSYALRKFPSGETFASVDCRFGVTWLKGVTSGQKQILEIVSAMETWVLVLGRIE